MLFRVIEFVITNSEKNLKLQNLLKFVITNCTLRFKIVKSDFKNLSEIFRILIANFNFSDRYTNKD